MTGVATRIPMARATRLAIIGFGNVGKALARLLLSKRDELNARGVQFVVTGIFTARHGHVIARRGLNLEEALAVDNLWELKPRRPAIGGLEFIRTCPADIAVEVSTLNPFNGEPALGYITEALSRSISVVTANKGPIAFAYPRLMALAREHSAHILFESTVMDGCPIFSLVRETLPCTRILGFRAILNSTSNLIIQKVEEGSSLKQAIAYSQEIGIAETNPSYDLDGYDAQIKTSILVQVIMGECLPPSKVARNGMGHLTEKVIRKAVQQGKHYHLIATAFRNGKDIEASVDVQLLSKDDRLAFVTGTSNGIFIETDTLRSIFLSEENPGPAQTAYGVLADCVHVAEALRKPARKRIS